MTSISQRQTSSSRQSISGFIPPSALLLVVAMGSPGIAEEYNSARPSCTKANTVTAKVVRDAGGRFVVRYRGKWESNHLRDGDPNRPIRCVATGDGVGIYDPAAGKLVSLVWVLTGTAENTPTAAVVEWEDTPGAN